MPREWQWNKNVQLNPIKKNKIKLCLQRCPRCSWGYVIRWQRNASRSTVGVAHCWKLATKHISKTLLKWLQFWRSKAPLTSTLCIYVWVFFILLAAQLGTCFSEPSSGFLLRFGARLKRELDCLRLCGDDGGWSIPLPSPSPAPLM